MIYWQINPELANRHFVQVGTTTGIVIMNQWLTMLTSIKYVYLFVRWKHIRQIKTSTNDHNYGHLINQLWNKKRFHVSSSSSGNLLHY